MKDGVWAVNLEHGERWWYTHIAELPGCFTRGETRETVLEALPGAIEQHTRFLESRGVTLRKKRGFEIAEVIEGIPELGESGGAVALFRTDLRPVEESELRGFLDLMRWNREELMGLVEPLPEYAIVAIPIPGKRSIERTLRHIANAEEWYISRMGASVQRRYEDYLRELRGGKRRLGSLERLRTVREGAARTLLAAFPEKCFGTFKRAAYTKYPEELWTLRKVLRRFVEHEREHIGTITGVIEALMSSSRRGSEA